MAQLEAQVKRLQARLVELTVNADLAAEGDLYAPMGGAAGGLSGEARAVERRTAGRLMERVRAAEKEAADLRTEAAQLTEQNRRLREEFLARLAAVHNSLAAAPPLPAMGGARLSPAQQQAALSASGGPHGHGAAATSELLALLRDVTDRLSLSLSPVPVTGGSGAAHHHHGGGGVAGGAGFFADARGDADVAPAPGGLSPMRRSAGGLGGAGGLDVNLGSVRSSGVGLGGAAAGLLQAAGSASDFALQEQASVLSARGSDCWEGRGVVLHLSGGHGLLWLSLDESLPLVGLTG